MKLINQNSNSLQSYTEKTNIAANLTKGIVNVSVDCHVHGSQTVKTFAFRQDQVGCPECAKLERYAREAREFHQAKRQQALDNGIAERYYDCTINDYQAETDLQHKLVSYAKAWLTSFGKGSKNIALLGATGTGKTMLASILATAVMSNGYAVKMIRSSDIAEQVRATWKSHSRISENDLMQSWINCDLLVIDEFGEGDIAVNADWSDQDRMRLSKIIDGRYQNGNPTIITSNFEKQQFFGRLGARALDRFQQNAMLVVCNWVSYRKVASDFVELA